MKKIFLVVLLSSGFLVMSAQNIDQISEMVNKSQFKQAKDAIDKYVADPKTSKEADGWFFKGKIYNFLSADKTYPDSAAYNLKKDAFEAFKKYQALEPGDIRLKLEQWSSYLELYYGLYDLGAKQFNTQNYNGSYEAFKKALEVKDYILSKKYTYSQVTLYALDTVLVVNTAKAANLAKRTDEGLAYYQKLAGASVAGPEYQEVYEYLADYYSKKGDDVALKPLLEKAKRLYPKDEFWSELELNGMRKSGDKQALFAKYEELLAKNPNDATTSYNYGVELYQDIYGKDAKTTTDLTARNKLTEVLKNAIKNEKGREATVLMANHLFNMSADILNESNMIKSTKPDDIKKKNDLKTLANKTIDDCITYSENAAQYFAGLPELKAGQKANYHIVLGYLSNLYNIKNNPKKAAEYDAKIKAL